MKKTFFLLLFLAATCLVYSQGNTLYKVNVVKPKAGMKSAFEASYKLHVATFHKSPDKRYVREVVSGPNLGSYVISEGPISYADMDKTNPNAKAHALDLERTFNPKIEPGSINALARWVDTLSRNGDVKAEKFLVTITVVKDGKMGEYLSETRRGILTLAKMNSPYSVNVLIKQQAGSSPTVYSVRNLKDGYKELEENYLMAPNAFKDAYVGQFGQEAWDKRVKLLVDDVVSREQHFEITRADLSSK